MGNIFFLRIFFKNFGCDFSRSNTLLDRSQEWLVRLMWNKKKVHQLDTGWPMWLWAFDLNHDLDLGYFKVKFQNSCISGIVIWLMWHEKKANQLETGWLYGRALWPYPWSWPWSFKVKVWNSLISGMGGLIGRVGGCTRQWPWWLQTSACHRHI